jgi:hypothetical protein
MVDLRLVRHVYPFGHDVTQRGIEELLFGCGMRRERIDQPVSEGKTVVAAGGQRIEQTDDLKVFLSQDRA